MQTQYITDHNGNKVAVILPIADYQKMIEDLEEMEDIKLYDEAKKETDQSLPAEEVFNMIEKERKKG